MDQRQENTDFTSVLKLFLGAAVGFSAAWLISHPKSRVKRNLPQKNVKGFQVFPNIRLVKENKIYRFHHWMVLASLYFPLLWKKGNFLKYKLLHGMVIGSILQGLSFKDRFNIIYSQTQKAIQEKMLKLEHKGEPKTSLQIESAK